MRFDRAQRALILAFSRDDLRPGVTTHDAVGTIIYAATGSRVAAWWSLLLAYRNGTLTREDEGRLRVICKATGYSPSELSAIESAFEDDDLDLAGMGSFALAPVDSVSTRLGRVMDLLLLFETDEQEKEVTSNHWTPVSSI